MALLSKFENNTTSKKHFLKLICGLCSVKSIIFLTHLYKKSTRSHKIIKLVEAQNKQQSSSNGKSGKRVDKRFFHQLKTIIRILIPSWKCPEVGYMSLVTVMLIVRALCDLWTIYLGTLIESAIICGEPLRFNRLIAEFAMTMPTMTLTNATLKYSIRQLEIRFRSRLTHHLMEKYMHKLTFYKLNQSERNIDQLITTDVEKFTSTLANLYSQMSKPLLDIIIYVYGISSTIGASVPGTMLLYLAGAAAVIARLRKPMARLTATEQSLEGEFRFGNSRIITNSEEIAFYKGGDRELHWMLSCFNNLYRHLDGFTGFKFIMEFFENLIAKYMATIVGYYAVSRPFFAKSRGGQETGVLATAKTHQQRQETYYKSGRMLLNLALAMGRFILNTKDLTRLAGYTSRVSHLMEMLDQINDEENARNSEGDRMKNSAESLSTIPSQTRGKHRNNKKAAVVPNISGVGVGRYVVQDHIIRFEQVPIVTPNGDVLVKALSMEVKSGTNVLVCGPNGCGKSSLFRILGELWPLRGGVLTKPIRDQLFYVPQKPYMPYGTFRDQIIYPDTKQDMLRKGRKDEDLLEYLGLVDLEWIVDLGETGQYSNGRMYEAKVSTALLDAVSEGAGQEESTNFRGSKYRMDAIENWMDVLSGGQKQRIGQQK
ncbi:ATP-binding cassette sub-family D member 3 [Orchesella cincta]|uniref:ATP-binding cassette sub-family D member 3 n=1 Tax=Orchesella cincta TaxID=48709 RepID=A0A1D2NJD6_ORCCI|nr:ATP-binding cassette sub-family D member 3 [Orchesella cincta]